MLKKAILVVFCFLGFAAAIKAECEKIVNLNRNKESKDILYIYTLKDAPAKVMYDTAAAVASIQGVINRHQPELYVLNPQQGKSKYWLNVLADDGGWLWQRKQEAVTDLDGLVKLAGKRLKGAVVWDPAVPATFNVATTVAGVEDLVVLSPEFAEEHLDRWGLKAAIDLRNMFCGSITGSSKNDAYRWAIKGYLKKGKCSSKLLCLFEDASKARDEGDIGYVVTRDWAVKNRSFVFDLSVWGDENPKDDPNQPMGTDLATYKMVLEETFKQSAGQYMTELSGFFSFWKYSNIAGYPSKHGDVPTEWETVSLISPFNVYQNTISSLCYNQSFHSQMPFKGLKQRRPKLQAEIKEKAYICILMADFDSTTPLYDFMPRFWDDPNRGKLPLAWGINPNLLETYPDVISHYYNTATDNDFFTSDASAAGYMNPNRIKAEHMPLFVEHNKKFFELADMTIAPMVLDWAKPTVMVKDAFAQFSPDGYATIIIDYHKNNGADLIIQEPHIWEGMPVMELMNDICSPGDTKARADTMYQGILRRGYTKPGFYFFRIVWTSPSEVIEILNKLRLGHPDLDFEVVDPYNFFALFKKYWQASKRNKD